MPIIKSATIPKISTVIYVPARTFDSTTRDLAKRKKKLFSVPARSKAPTETSISARPLSTKIVQDVSSPIERATSKKSLIVTG
jgi:hypothetical protein